MKQYVGTVAKQVQLCKHKHLQKALSIKEEETQNIAIIEKMIGYQAKEPIKIKDITITPYFVSHSAADSNMFLIQADGKRILHTGDYRGHGYLSKGLIPTVKKYILSQGKIDFLISEGTMLSRLKEKVMTENDLQQEVKKVMRQYKNVFILASSTDMERLASFYSANIKTNNRLFITDDYQADVLKVFTENAGKYSPLFKFDILFTVNPWKYIYENAKYKIKKEGMCMLMRTGKGFVKFYNNIKPILKDEETVIIYSMWSQYINPKSKHLIKNYYDFVNMFPNIVQLHTSGHASAETLEELCNTANPQLGIIPIHSEQSDNYKKLNIKAELKERIISKSQTVDGVSIKLNIDYGETNI